MPGIARLYCYFINMNYVYGKTRFYRYPVFKKTSYLYRMAGVLGSTGGVALLIIFLYISKPRKEILYCISGNSGRCPSGTKSIYRSAGEFPVLHKMFINKG